MSETNEFPTGKEHPRAMRLSEFCARYGVSRSKAYRELQANRLVARKIGTRTIVTVEDAELWLSKLPKLKSKKC